MQTPCSANVILNGKIRKMSVLYTAIQILCSDIILILSKQLLINLATCTIYTCELYCMHVYMHPRIKSNTTSKWYPGVNGIMCTIVLTG